MPRTSSMPHYCVVDCRISRTNIPGTITETLARVGNGLGGYICFANVHSVVTAAMDGRLRRIINDSFLSVPDGKPLSIVARLKGHADVGQVPGPDFMPALIHQSKNLRHFFYGSTGTVLDALTANLKKQFPHANIVGRYSPPFRTLSDSESKEIIAHINNAKPDIIWVGLGAPKQEYWMADNWRQLRPAILMGVGAAFDFHAGVKKRAPVWMRHIGLEWLHRFAHEPKRLWRRYLVTNPLFIYYLVRNTLRHGKCC
jgi:N-acetylglucosaminyldiphosphoundecaprenol N-acetyl-beta-D-mannosaminyltransferase